jgi:prevent-host-death family protein
MERAAAGDDVVVTRHGRRFVRIGPAEPPPAAASP